MSFRLNQVEEISWQGVKLKHKVDPYISADMISVLRIIWSCDAK